MAVKKPARKKKPAKKKKKKQAASCSNRNYTCKLQGGQTAISKLFKPRNRASKQAAIFDLCYKIRRDQIQAAPTCIQSTSCTRARRTCTATGVAVTHSDVDLVVVNFSNLNRKAFAIANNATGEKRFTAVITCECL